MREDERQVLIALIELSEPVETENNTTYHFYPATLEQAAAYFGDLRGDWTLAYPSLVEQKALAFENGTYVLTEWGKTVARQERLDHPPIYYWYRAFFPAAARSRAYARFCEKLYGMNFYQAGFSDLDQVREIIKFGRLGPESRILELGCGLGGITEYLSDQTGARAWGVDYIPEAVDLARQRTHDKRDRLDFWHGNLDHLEKLDGQWDTLVSVDTLYMPNDLPQTLSAMRSLLRSGGQMLIFYSHFLFQPGESRDHLKPEGNALGAALAEMGFSYEAKDFSEATHHLMRRKHRLALEMQSEFEAENSQFLLDFILRESDGGESPFDPEMNIYSRYMYRVECQAVS